MKFVDSEAKYEALMALASEIAREADLPPIYLDVLAPSLQEDFDLLQSRLRQRLEEVRGLKEKEAEARGDIEKVRENIEALREQREAEVLRPRRRAREATISLARDMEDAKKEVETRPDKTHRLRSRSNTSVTCSAAPEHSLESLRKG